MILKDGEFLQSSEPETYKIVTRNQPKEPKQRIPQRPPKKRHRILRGIVKTILILILILIILAIVVGGFAAYKIYGIVKDVKFSKNDITVKYENSVVKDAQGNTLAVLNGNENRISISLDDMAEYLPKAFISIEDERFYEHNGVDIKRTLRAAYTYITNHGQSDFGGSTITQQMVKNVTEEKEDTWQRKVREMARAYYIEQEMSKEEILELYLNLIFLGDTVCGVEQGSNYYFNKPAKDLSLAECAFLAGINHSPNAYNPFVENNEQVLENIKNRTITVLNKMHELGNINTEEEYLQALEEVRNGLAFNQGAKVETVYSYHTDAALTQIINELQEKNNWTYDQAKLYLFGGGFTIYTTQNQDLQAKMQEEFNDGKYRTTTTDANGNVMQSQSAMVLVEPGTGHVVAICSGFDEKTTAFGFNRATQAVRQTGSSMKPIAVLAPAIEKGVITATTVFDDDPTSFEDGKYEPKNLYGYRGLITVRDAIAYSQNIPMVKAMCLLTPKASMEFLKSVGITSLVDEDEGLSLSLG